MTPTSNACLKSPPPRLLVPLHPLLLVHNLIHQTRLGWNYVCDLSVSDGSRKRKATRIAIVSLAEEEEKRVGKIFLLGMRLSNLILLSKVNDYMKILTDELRELGAGF